MKRRKKARLYQREAIDKFLATLPTDAALRTIVHGAQVQDKLANDPKFAGEAWKSRQAVAQE